MLSENQMVAARKAIEITYSGVCTIIERRDTRNEKTKVTRKSEEIIAENVPCKLSFERINSAAQTETATALTQGTKLFAAPEIPIKPGSKVIVEQNGVKTEYSASGAPAIYFSHQEIMLELFRGWA